MRCVTCCHAVSPISVGPKNASVKVAGVRLIRVPFLPHGLQLVVFHSWLGAMAAVGCRLWGAEARHWRVRSLGCNVINGRSTINGKSTRNSLLHVHSFHRLHSVRSLARACYARVASVAHGCTALRHCGAPYPTEKKHGTPCISRCLVCRAVHLGVSTPPSAHRQWLRGRANTAPT